jgi:hypothetical protein
MAAAQPIAHIVVNSLEPDARARLGLVQQIILSPALLLAKLIWGGLWVGGDVYIEDGAVRFEPNEANKKLHYGDLSWRLPFTTIVSVSVRKATVTDIIDINHSGGKKSMRCYGAIEFARQIDAARTQVGG